MYNRQLCVADDSYQLAHEHVRQLECAGHLGASTESSPLMLVSGKHQVLDGEKEHFDSKSDEGRVCLINRVCSVADKEFKKRTVNIPSVDSAIVLTSSSVADCTCGSEALENGKRPSSNFCGGVVNKRARLEDQAWNLGRIAGNSPVSISSEGKCSSELGWRRAAADMDASGKSLKEVDNRLNQPAQFCFFLGLEDYHQRTGFDQLEDFHSPLSEHSHRRHVSIGPNHQAHLPQWNPRDSKNVCNPSDCYVNSAPNNETASSSTELDIDDANADKWLGTCVMPMPNLDLMANVNQIYCSKIDCDCTDEGSIRCVRQHIMEAREKLSRALGQEKFREMGFSDMGEVVAQRWTEEEENLFHKVLLSNPASLGRNFWSVLPRTFLSRSFKDLVSYYFNVFILRKRADQNHFDPLNVDSDNDEWQRSCDGEFDMSEDFAEEDSVVESPADGNSLSLNGDFSVELEIHEEVDDEEEYEDCLVGTEDEGFHCGSDECNGYESMPPIDRNSSDCSDDQDVQDDSCTSYEGMHDISDSCHGHIDRFSIRGNHVYSDHQNLHLEYTSDSIIKLADYEFIDGHGDSKSWDINYIGGSVKDIDLFPTCNVLEEVFGKGSWDKDVRDGSDFN